MNENTMIPLTDFASDIQNVSTAFCSMDANTAEEKKILFNAMNNPDERLSDCVNKIIKIKDVYCETVQMVNEQTGEVTEAPRIVLIDVDGKSYQSVSSGVYNSLKKLMQIYGVPTWDEPIAVIPKQLTKGSYKIMTLSLA